MGEVEEIKRLRKDSGAGIQSAILDIWIPVPHFFEIIFRAMRVFILQAFNVVTRITRWLSIVAAGSMALLMIVNFTDIIGTKFFLKSVSGALDISEELMVLLTLLPLAFIALERGHIRITLLEERLPMAIRFILQMIQYGVAMLITGFVTWRVFIQFLKTVEVMQLKEGIDLPIWPANLAVVIAFGFLTLAWVLLFAKTLVVGIEGKGIGED